MANIMVGAGMARTRMGGSWGHVPLWRVSLDLVAMYEKENVRNEFDHDEEPANRQVPVEPVEIPSFRTNDSAAGVLLPKPVEADKVLDNRHGTEQRRADTEDCVCG